MPATSRWAPLGLPRGPPIAACVAKHELAAALEPVERRLVAGEELALGMGDRQAHSCSMPARKTQRSPRRARLTQRSMEPARRVPGERGALPCGVVAVQQAALNEHLKAVADAEDQLAGVAEAASASAR